MSSVTLPPLDAKELKDKMANVKRIIAENPLQGWDKLWQENITPWDAGQAQPPLKHLIESDALDLPKQGRALIPGCGRGYDAVLIAATLGLDTLAVDISPIAMKAAQDMLDATSPPPAGDVTFKVLNFFELEFKEEEKFDLIYDYTFFVAILPSMRALWGKQMTSLAKTGGYLITLMFPLDQTEPGPPFRIVPVDYEQVLGDHWEKILEKIPEASMDSHRGRERLIVWRRR